MNELTLDQSTTRAETEVRAPSAENGAKTLPNPGCGFRVCVIIPTKNRAADLVRAVRSVLEQTVAPCSIVIVDQSRDGESQERIRSEIDKAKRESGCLWRLTYILAPEITGSATARNRAMQVADGDIWLFLDDDVVLEQDFIEQIIQSYRDNRDAVGISGIITNQPRLSVMFSLWTKTFKRGPFHDERQPIYWNAERLRNSGALPVKRFGGGLMSFRSNAVRGKYFDTNLSGVSDGEDVDFCARLGADTRLLIAPRARLVHNHSPSERLQDHWLRREVRGNFFIYKKNWNRALGNRCCYAWLFIGFTLAAGYASVRRLSWDPWRALIKGVSEANGAVVKSRPKGR